MQMGISCDEFASPGLRTANLSGAEEPLSPFLGLGLEGMW